MKEDPKDSDRRHYAKSSLQPSTNNESRSNQGNQFVATQPIIIDGALYKPSFRSSVQEKTDLHQSY